MRQWGIVLPSASDGDKDKSGPWALNALGEDETTDDVVVSYHFGFPGDLGGGPYDRTDDTPLDTPDWQKGVAKSRSDTDFQGIRDAVAEWNGADQAASGAAEWGAMRMSAWSSASTLLPR